MARWALCGGMMRSGSTLQFQIAARLVEEAGRGERVGWSRPGTFPELRDRHADAEGWRVFKSHDCTPEIREEIVEREGAGIYVYRDLRDVMASVMRKEGLAFDDLWESGYLDACVENFEAWTSLPGVLVSRYEEMVADVPGEVRRIGERLGIEVDDATSERIAAEFSMESQRDRARRVEREGAGRFDPYHLLHGNHITDGRSGSWRDTLRPSEVERIEARHGRWLSENGYAPDARLGRRAPLRSLARSARRLAGKTLRKAGIPVPRLTRLPWGDWWVVRDDVVSRRIARPAEYEADERRLVDALVGPGMRVFDIGAHHGFYSLLASERVGDDGSVTSFEPSTRERRRLRLHLWLNRRSNVTVEPLALGSRAETADLYVCEGVQTGCNSLRPPAVEESTRSVPVTVDTLDDYCRRRGIERIDVVKMDVEGAELEVLKGGERSLDDLRPVILCEVADKRTAPWGYRAWEICAFLAERDYDLYRVAEGGGIEPLGEEREMDDNVLAVPRAKRDLLAALGTA